MAIAALIVSIAAVAATTVLGVVQWRQGREDARLKAEQTRLQRDLLDLARRQTDPDVRLSAGAFGGDEGGLWMHVRAVNDGGAAISNLQLEACIDGASVARHDGAVTLGPHGDTHLFTGLRIPREHVASTAWKRPTFNGHFTLRASGAGGYVVEVDPYDGLND